MVFQWPNDADALRRCPQGPQPRSGAMLVLTHVSSIKIRREASKRFAKAVTFRDVGCEGIVSKDRIRPYRSGPSKTWLKIKNSAAPGVTRFEDRDASAQS